MVQHNPMLVQQTPTVSDLTDPTMKHPNTTTVQILTLTKSAYHQHN
jgi:hypothetical protein